MATGTFTEEEQGRYDRQIRLWGIEAQQRMRGATILVVRLKGTATEVIKNIVLAGIGKLVISDDEVVTEEDLGAGFFFRDEDVGKKRAAAAKHRVESLNPLVHVETIPTISPTVDDKTLESTLEGVNLVCLTEWDMEGLIRVNDVCRRLNIPFYAGGTYGLLGYIFCDLLVHDYITPDRSTQPPQKNIKFTTSYVSLKEALNHKWSNLTRKQTKELNLATLFIILGIWEFQSVHGRLPSAGDHAELQAMADRILANGEVNKQVLTTVPEELVQSMTTTAAHEFSPVCAIVGGMLAQDILKTLAAKEAPIANFFAFDGNIGGGTVARMGI